MHRKEPSYKFGIEYDVSDSSMLFASHSTGYRVEPEAMNWRMEALPPQKIISYEIGAKNRFFGNKLQINASAFYYDYTNLVFVNRQDAYIDPVTRTYDPTGIRVSDQGGRMPGNLRMYGTDIQTSWIISPQDRLELSVSYLDNWIESLTADYEFDDQPYSDNYEFGNREPITSPKLTIGLDYSHNFQLASGATLTARFDSRYQSEYKGDWLDFNPRTGADVTGIITQEAQHVDNVTLVYANSDGKWTVSGYVKNVGDYAVKRSASTRGHTLGPPRTYGAILSVRY
ncbi:TonB-dependent receptor [Deltaproteobacteria bacterium]|nr:TonB-dependent receptor [Deltaproteobacteria bacterium]